MPETITDLVSSDSDSDLDPTAEHRLYCQSISRRLRQQSRTNDTDEVQLHSVSSKLFEYDKDTKAWLLVTSGDVKILKHTAVGITGGQCRVTMTTFLNFVPDDSTMMRASTDSSRAWLFTCRDFSTNTGQGAVRTLALRFETSEVALMFKDKFENCRRLNSRVLLEKDGDEDMERTEQLIAELFCSSSSSSSSSGSSSGSGSNNNPRSCTPEESEEEAEVPLLMSSPDQSIKSWFPKNSVTTALATKLPESVKLSSDQLDQFELDDNLDVSGSGGMRGSDGMTDQDEVEDEDGIEELGSLRKFSDASFVVGEEADLGFTI